MISLLILKSLQDGEQFKTPILTKHRYGNTEVLSGLSSTATGCVTEGDLYTLPMEFQKPKFKSTCVREERQSGKPWASIRGVFAPVGEQWEMSLAPSHLTK